MRTTYGNHGNIFEDQYKYMEFRLLAKKAGKLHSSDGDIEKLEANMAELRSQFNIQEKIVKEEQTEEVVLRSKIAKLEDTLSNEKFLANVNDKVKAIKTQALKDLKDELEKLI